MSIVSIGTTEESMLAMDDVSLDKAFEELSADDNTKSEIDGEESTKEEAGKETGKNDKDTQPELDELEKLKQELAAKEKRIADEQAFIAKQAQEIGLLRKQSKKPQESTEELGERLLQNPKAVVSELIDEAKNNEELAKSQENLRMHEVKAEIFKRIPKFEELLPEIDTLLKEDGIDDSMRAQYKQNPYSSESIGTNINLARRAEISLALKAKEKEIEDLRLKTGHVAKKINSIAKQTPLITANSGQGSVSKEIDFNISEAQFMDMSEKELDELYKNVVAQN